MRDIDRIQEEIIDEKLDKAILNWDYRSIDLLLELQKFITEMHIQIKRLTKRYLEQTI